MSDIFQVFGTQLDPAVVQALQRHDKERLTGDRARLREVEREARKRRKGTARAGRRRTGATGATAAE